MTIGPWKPIELQVYDNKIVDVDIRSEVSESFGVNLTVGLTFSHKKPCFATFILEDTTGTFRAITCNIAASSGQAKVSLQFDPGDLKMWYPVGYGDQPLYIGTVELRDEVGKSYSIDTEGVNDIQHKKLLDVRTERLAFRRARVVQEKLIDQDGLTFLFEINNIRIFCGGRLMFQSSLYYHWFMFLNKVPIGSLPIPS